MKFKALTILFFLVPLIPCSKYFPLHGALESPERIGISWANLGSGTFQDSFEKYFATHFGFYAPLVKLDSTLNLALGETELNGSHCALIANDGVLLSPDEVAFFSRPLGEWEKISTQIDKLIEAEAKLKKMGVRLTLIYFPSKLKFFPKALPEKWRYGDSRPAQELIASIKEKLRQSKIPLIDVTEMIAPPFGFPLRSRHLSQLTSCQILGRLDAFSCLPETVGPASGSEDDIEQCLNSFHPFASPEILPKPGVVKVAHARKALLVGSSFMRELEAEAIRLRLFSDIHLLYYNRTDDHAGNSQPVVINEAWREMIRSREVILLDIFEPQPETLGYGFSEQIINEL